MASTTSGTTSDAVSDDHPAERLASGTGCVGATPRTLSSDSTLGCTNPAATIDKASDVQAADEPSDAAPEPVVRASSDRAGDVGRAPRDETAGDEHHDGAAGPLAPTISPTGAGRSSAAAGSRTLVERGDDGAAVGALEARLR